MTNILTRLLQPKINPSNKINIPLKLNKNNIFKNNPLEKNELI